MASTSATGKVSLVTTGVITQSFALGDQTAVPNGKAEKSFASGTGSGKINASAEFNPTPAFGATTTIDLTAPVVGYFDNTITFATIRFLYIVNKSLTADVEIGGAMIVNINNGVALSLFTLGPGGDFYGICSADGFTAGALTIENTHGSDAADVDVEVKGEE